MSNRKRYRFGNQCSYNPQTEIKQKGGIQKNFDLLECIGTELTKTVNNIDYEIKQLKKGQTNIFKIVHH